MAAQTTIRSIDPTYGSDQQGLVWGYRFIPGQAALPVTAEVAAECLATPDSASPEEFFWLHFSLANLAAESWLRRSLSLPDAFYESFQDAVGSTRLEQDADSLIAVMHDVLFDFKFDASAVATASLYIAPRLLVSARLRPLRSV